MGNTAAPTLLGGGVGPARTVAKGQLHIVPFTFAMSASYATGGDTWTPPSADVRGMELRQLVITGCSDNTRNYFWNGSASAPKVQAESRAGVEVAAATNLAASIVFGFAIYEA